jgi:hypothetical protein
VSYARSLYYIASDTHERLRELATQEKAFDQHWPKCYLSGPMTGLPYFNFHAFEVVAKQLRDAGWFVYSPRENDREKGLEPNPEGKLSEDHPAYKELMKTDLWQVCDSDAVFVMPGWEWSEGCKLEADVAHRVNVPVYSFPGVREIPAPKHVPHEFSSRAQPLKGLGLDEIEFLPRLKVGGTFHFAQKKAAPLQGTESPPAAPPLDFGEEYRGLDPDTGGTKGRRQATFAQTSLYADVEVAKVHGFGVAKYPDEATFPNWRKGMPWSWFYDALRRHIAGYWSGEDINPESGLLHLGHARWMIDSLIEYYYLELGNDDRPASVRRDR